LKKKEKKDKSY